MRITPASEDSMHRWIKHTVVVLSISLAACASGGGAPPATRSMESIPFASALDVNLARMTKTPAGVYYRDIDRKSTRLNSSH